MNLKFEEKWNNVWLQNILQNGFLQNPYELKGGKSCFIVKRHDQHPLKGKVHRVTDSTGWIMYHLIGHNDNSSMVSVTCEKLHPESNDREILSEPRSRDNLSNN